jgi:hypothetical protein
LPSRPDTWKHHVPSHEDQAFISLKKEPQSLKEAESLPTTEEWQAAMQSELKLLKELGTYMLTDLPERRRAIGSKWVFRIKKDDQGNITHHKARLVAQRFSQIPGMDFEINNTSSPIVRMETNRLLLALTTRYNLEIKMVDIKGAYLNGKLNEEIYMKQPEGYGNGTACIFKLHKTIYGLRQSGKVWNERLDKQFQKIQFK